MATNLTSRTIDSSGVLHLKKLAKRMAKELGCKLSEAQEFTAKEHGFKNWNNVHRFASKLFTPAPISNMRRRKMLIELKGKKETYCSVKTEGSLSQSMYSLTVNRTINLFMANSFWTETSFFNKNDPISRLTQKKKSERSTLGPSQIEVDLLCLEIGTGENKEHHSFIFTDKDEYHRVMKSIDDARKNV